MTSIKPIKRGTGNDQRKWHIGKENTNKPGDGDQPIHRMCQPSHRHFGQCLQNDHTDPGLKASEQRHRPTNSPKIDIANCQCQHHRGAGQNKQAASQQTAAHPMQPPARIGGELHRFWPRQQHTKAKCVGELLFAEPASLCYDFTMHQGNLRGRPAE